MRVRRAVVVLATVACAIAAPLGAGAAASVPLVQQGTATVAGKVADSNGAPLSNICVEAYRQAGSLQTPIGITDAAGNYQMTGLALAGYLFVYEPCLASSPNVQPQFYDGALSVPKAYVVLTDSETYTLDEQTMKPGSTISLQITDSSQQPVKDLLVVAKAAGGDAPDVETYLNHQGMTGADGTVVLKGLLPTRYTLNYQSCPDIFCASVGYYPHLPWEDADSAQLVPVAAGQTVDLSDTFDVPTVISTTADVMASPASVTVGEPVTFAVKVTGSDGRPAPGTVTFWLASTTTELDEIPLAPDGTASFTTTELPVGDLEMEVYYSGNGLTAPTQSAASVTVKSASGGGVGGSPGVGVPVGTSSSGSVSPGGTFSSDPSGTTPSSSDPLVVDVTSPAGGSVSVDKTPPNTVESGYQILNIGATISAPPASASAPLKLTFHVFDGGLPAGSVPTDLTVFRDGSPVGACAKSGVANPDPCLESQTTAGGVTTITVLSSHASTWDVEAADVGRIGGADRIATAVAVSQDSFPGGGAGAVVLATANAYPDALVGGPLAAAKRAPLLLTSGASLPSATAAEISRVLPKGGTVYLLGGTAAIPDSVASRLAGLGYNVVRCGGADRFATAVAVADALGDPSTVLLATGINFPDALAASPAAAHLHGAVLLTNGTSLPSATSAYLDANATTVYAIGGPAAGADTTATPVVGSDRFGTAADVAAKFFASPSTVGVATGTAFPDALSGGAQLALDDDPLLLAGPTSLPAATLSYLTGVGATVTTAHLYGGTAALSDAVRTQVTSALTR